MTLTVERPTVARLAEPPSTNPWPVWYLRRNPLVRTRLGDPELRDRLGRYTEAIDQTARAAAAAADELYGLVGEAAADESRRKDLLAWRRVVNHEKTPPDRPAPARTVVAWLTARAERDRQLADLEQAYDAAADRERGRLAGLLGQPDFARALALVAPGVYEESRRYREVAGGPGPVPARVRKSERGLVQYVSRALIRTSPLSRFTAVGLARPDPAGEAPEAVPFSGATAFLTLDRVMLSWVLSGLEAEGRDLGRCWVGRAPTSAMAEGGSQLLFLQPTPDGLRRLSVPASGIVGALLSATGMGPRPVAAVVAALSGAGLSTAEAEAAVQRAVAAGILSTWTSAEEGAADPDDQLRGFDEYTGGATGEVADHLQRLRDAVPEHRASALRETSARLAAVSAQARRPAEIKVDEDYVMGPTQVDPTPWAAGLADLGRASQLPPLPPSTRRPAPSPSRRASRPWSRRRWAWGGAASATVMPISPPACWAWTTTASPPSGTSCSARSPRRGRSGRNQTRAGSSVPAPTGRSAQ